MRTKMMILVIILIAITLFISRKLFIKSDDSRVTIGIIQTASHPALDRVRQGFIKQITESIPNVYFIEQNAEGIASQAQTIAASFHANKRVSSIVAIGTLASQAIASVEKNKPIFISAVTDPVSVGLIQSNITGSSDKIPVAKQFELITSLTPQVKRIALLFTTGEINSTAAVAEMKTVAAQKGFETVEIGIQNSADIVAAVTAACNKTDALLLPNDNILSPAIVTIARIASDKSKPLFVSDPALVERGALACVGIDYEKSGRDTAVLAEKVIKEHISPDSLPIIYEQNPPIFVNKKTAD